MWWCNLLSNTVFQTVVSGVMVFVLGQLFIEYVLKPLQHYKMLRAKAAYCITFYRNRYDLSMPVSNLTSEELRKMAAELSAFAIEKPVVIFTVRQKCLNNASSHFIGLSNSVSASPDYDLIEENIENIKKILKLL